MSANTVVFLDTGAGKTLIAGMLLRAYAHRVRKPAREFAVFLVPKCVLVEQQARVVEAYTDLRVSKFTGDMEVDLCNPATWRRVVDDAEVLVMTPQILLDNLQRSFFRLEDIALLIFDECHHAKGNDPYACILKVPKVTTPLPFRFLSCTQ
jgi:endoribonuclease Dicer